MKYTIDFNFHPDGIEHIAIPLSAIAEFDQAGQYFMVHSFCIRQKPEISGKESALPVQFIKLIRENGADNWVHTDSEKSSHLSLAIGAALSGCL